MTEKKQHSPQQNNLRAKNILWTAARDYEIAPQFLSFEKDGTPEFYMNTIAGLIYKWLDAPKIEALFNSFVGTAFHQNYENYLWIALEHNLFYRENAVRPAMKKLREIYARATIQKIEKITEQWKVPEVQLANAQRILGENPFIVFRNKSILEELEKFEREMTTDEIISEYLLFLNKYYKYKPSENKARLRKPLFNIFVKRKSAAVRMAKNDEKKAAPSGKRKSIKSMIFPSHEERVRMSLERAFGKPIFNLGETAVFERELCTGNHASSRLFFAGNDAPSNTFERNRNYFREHRNLHQTAILQLVRRLQNSLNTYAGDSFLKTRGGQFDSTRAWRAVHLSDEIVFKKKSLDEMEPFSVDLLLDASASQMQKEKIIAAQAYIIAEALVRCGVPVQVYSFNSFSVFTAIHVFRKYEDISKSLVNEKIFRYGAAGYNRDGLALRVAGKLMKNSPAETRLLIVLSDADPNDDRNFSGRTLGDSYSGEMAVSDSAEEIRKLRSENIKVSAIFTGSDADLTSAKRIYGNDFVRITDVRQLAEAVAGIVLRHVGNG